MTDPKKLTERLLRLEAETSPFPWLSAERSQADDKFIAYARKHSRRICEWALDMKKLSDWRQERIQRLLAEIERLSQPVTHHETGRIPDGRS